jgi:hypothetical protein
MVNKNVLESLDQFKGHNINIDFHGAVITNKLIYDTEVFCERCKGTDVLVLSDGWEDGVRIEADKIVGCNVDVVGNVNINLGNNMDLEIYSI